MTTQADIKRVIDQLNNLEVVHDYDENVTDDAAQMLAALGNQAKMDSDLLDEIGKELEPVKYTGSYADGVRMIKRQITAQAVEITKLRECFQAIKEYNLHYGLPLDVINLYKEALSTPTDSKQVLAEWLDSVMGEPVGFMTADRQFRFETPRKDIKAVYFKPERLK